MKLKLAMPKFSLILITAGYDIDRDQSGPRSSAADRRACWIPLRPDPGVPTGVRMQTGDPVHAHYMYSYL